MGDVHHLSIEVPWGVIHSRRGACGAGEPIVLLHQTPRSGDEFREVIEVLGENHHLLALDLPGMGHSTTHPEGNTIDAYADGVLAALNAIDATSLVLVGHHTGAAVAASVAAAEPQRVNTLVLSSPPWIDEETRSTRRARTGPGIDEVTRTETGTHLSDLWAGRAGFYPQGRQDLLDRFVADALLVADPGAGHRAVTEWAMEDTLPTLRTLPVVLVDHQTDPHAHPNIERWQAALAGATVRSIPTGMVPLEYTADAFVEMLAEVLSA